jgi:magnesium-transporting ATPase (P-type)
MTGESDERRKEPYEDCMKRHEDKAHLSSKNTYHTTAHLAHKLPSPLILSGTGVAGGDGRYLALVGGDASALGEILAKTQVRDQETPLQQKLDQIAADIGVVGTIFALLTVHGLMLLYFVNGLLYRNIDLFGGEAEGPNKFVQNLELWVQYFIIGVAIICVAVPEGLPLAVMISLAYSIKKMLKDKCYVKRLAACEIMGGATDICSDKTGTLTLNRMTCTRIYVGKDV